MGWKQLILEVEALLGRMLTPQEAEKVRDCTTWGLVNPHDIVRELGEGA
jgi:hypothetical protein